MDDCIYHEEAFLQKTGQTRFRTWFLGIHVYSRKKHNFGSQSCLNPFGLVQDWKQTHYPVSFEKYCSNNIFGVVED
jgi:hypothetical protein